MKKRSGTVLTGGKLLLMACMTLGIPSVQGEPTRFKDWAGECERLANGDSSCHIVQNVVDPNSGSVVLRAEVGFIPGQSKSLLLVTVPLGVDLRPGLDLRIDSAAPRKLAYYVCSPDGCRAALAFDQALINAMKRGAKARITLSKMDGRRQDVPLSLMGFTKGYNSLRP